MIIKKKLVYTLFVLISLVALSLVYSPISQAQNWTAMAPYNTLWPLWSPALSPVDSITGLPTPIVNELLPSTVLPVQPGLTWDPAAANPWLLYNTPLGMTYFDPIDGINLWPPSYLRDTTTGGPLPISLPIDYGFLPPTPNNWLSANIPLGNTAAFSYLKTLGGPIFPAPIFGAPIAPTFGGLFLAPSAFFPIAPPAIAPLPIPTAITPLPIPTAISPLLVPTVITPLPVPTAISPLLVPTVITPLPIPSALAPLPVPSFVAPSAIAPSALIPTALATAPVIVPPVTTAIPLAIISGLFL